MPVFSSYFFCFSNAVEAILYGVDLIGSHMRSYSLARLGVILSPVIALIISSFNHFVFTLAYNELQFYLPFAFPILNPFSFLNSFYIRLPALHTSPHFLPRTTILLNNNHANYPSFHPINRVPNPASTAKAGSAPECECCGKDG